MDSDLDSHFYLPTFINVLAAAVFFALGLPGNVLSLAVIVKSSQYSTFKRLAVKLSGSNSNSLISAQNSCQETDTASRGKAGTFKIKQSLNLPSKKYLAVFLITNIVFLLVHTYSSTLNRLIYLFRVNINVHFSNQSSTSADSSPFEGASFDNNPFYIRYNLIDTNRHVCRLMYYLKNVCRLMNSVTIASFSLERLLAVYEPIRLIHYKSQFHKWFSALFVGLIVVSFVLPLFLLERYDIVSVLDHSSNLGLNKGEGERDVIVKSSFNYHSITPTYSAFTCHLSDKGPGLSRRLHTAFVFILTSLYLLVSFTLILVVVRLKRTYKFTRSSHGYKIKFISRMKQRYPVEESASLNSKKSGSITGIKSTKLPSTNQPGNVTTELQSSLKDLRNFSINYRVDARVKNQRVQNHVLFFVSAVFLVTNLPYFTGALIYFYKQATLNSNVSNSVNLKFNVKFNSVYIVLEILHLANHSMSSLALFFSGKLFRTYLISLICRRR